MFICFQMVSIFSLGWGLGNEYLDLGPSNSTATGALPRFSNFQDYNFVRKRLGEALRAQLRSKLQVQSSSYMIKALET